MRTRTKKQSSTKKRQIRIMKKGFNLGEKEFKSRDNLYDRE